jgi:hypothetical protein
MCVEKKKLMNDCSHFLAQLNEKEWIKKDETHQAINTDWKEIVSPFAVTFPSGMYYSRGVWTGAARPPSLPPPLSFSHSPTASVRGIDVGLACPAIIFLASNI